MHDSLQFGNCNEGGLVHDASTSKVELREGWCMIVSNSEIAIREGGT